MARSKKARATFLTTACPPGLFKNRKTFHCVKNQPTGEWLSHAEDCPEGFLGNMEKKRCYKGTRRAPVPKKKKSPTLKVLAPKKSPTPKVLAPKKSPTPKAPTPKKSPTPKPPTPKAPTPKSPSIPNESRDETLKMIKDWYLDPRNAAKDMPEEFSFENKNMGLPGIVKHNAKYNISLSPEEAAEFDKLLPKRRTFQLEFEKLKAAVKAGRIDMDDPRALYNKMVKAYLTGVEEFD
jgi:hypothetical protein